MTSIWHELHDLTRHQEATVTPAAPQQGNVLDDIESQMDYLLGKLRSNALIGVLFSGDHGKHLNGEQIDHVVAIVRAIEEPHQEAENAKPAAPSFVPADDVSGTPQAN